MATNPTPAPTSKLSEILEAILAGLQIAAEALPVVLQYKTAFGSVAAAPMFAPLLQHANDAHPVTGSIVSAAITPALQA